MPETAQDADLLTAAAVALHGHAQVLREIGKAFEAAGYQLYLVGGSVRDAILGRLSPDLDFTTDARPEQVQTIVRPWADAVWDTGIDFGTIGASWGSYRLEITTFRADRYDQISR
ncbi:MAG: CCA tRNA nucleotidyltransferase, partial [Mycobacteriaceae bacterium]|nr:CCA tRNA nucleotidyltransferase [Mycobacteriaceae bacterium]